MPEVFHMTEKTYYFSYETPLGSVTIAEKDSAVTHLFLSESRSSGSIRASRFLSENACFSETPLLKKTYIELSEYFDGKRTVFDIPVDPEGTAFQKKVWKVLCGIPYGETMTYGMTAALAGNPKASRAVGAANNRNPVMIIIPCHRVIGADGSLTGYAGGIDVKEKLLDLERKVTETDRDSSGREDGNGREKAERKENGRGKAERKENGRGKAERKENGRKDPDDEKSGRNASDISVFASEIRKRLETLAEPEYRQFSSSLLPGTENILGVRLPALRAEARKIAGDPDVSEKYPDHILNIRNDPARCQAVSFEEIMLAGFVTGMVKKPLSEKIPLIRRFVAVIDNWSVCDSFCVTLKPSVREREEFLPVIRAYALSEKEFESRFAAVMLLDHYVIPEYIDNVLEILGSIRSETYYSQMGVAWAVSVCFAEFPEKTLAFMEKRKPGDHSPGGSRDPALFPETYNKAIRKIIESYRVSDEMKKRIRQMKVRPFHIILRQHHNVPGYDRRHTEPSGQGRKCRGPRLCSGRNG